jgi:hypothetical protein
MKQPNVVQLSRSVRHMMVRTDDLSRHPESQVRAGADQDLVAEYATAMLEGAEFPPVVIYEDDDGRYLADGHHRVDAAALTALRDPSRKAEVFAEVRPGSFADALRHAMRANRLHGMRMVEADYERAIEMAFDNELITVRHAREVVPAIVELTGCSIRTAQVNSASFRRAMNAKRDRLIWSMHSDGRTQEAIGVELEVSQQTVSRVIDTRKRSTAGTGKLKQRKPPPSPSPVIKKDETDTAFLSPPLRIRTNVSVYLPLLERLAPITEDDGDSGAVGALPDVTEGDDPAAVKALQHITETLTDTLAKLEKLDALRRRFNASAAEDALKAIERASDFLRDLSTYIQETPQ